MKNVIATDKRCPSTICRASRAGLSTLEFLGCVIAVVGGAWLGAIYLGVDVRHLAHTALTEAQLIDRLPPDWRPAAPQHDGLTRDQLVATLHTELDSLRSDIRALRGADAKGKGAHAERTTDTPAVAKDKTRRYWLRLSEIALGETALQRDAESALNDANAARVFDLKARISRFAAKAIQALPSDGVDQAVVQFGQELAGWYERGGDLYTRGVAVRETPATSNARERLNREWRGAELHHRNEARLLNERAAAVRGTMSRHFAEEFPEFAAPAL